MSALSGSFEYLCYGSTAIINILILSVRGSSLYVSIWRMLTYTDGPRTERVNICCGYFLEFWKKFFDLKTFELICKREVAIDAQMEIQFIQLKMSLFLNRIFSNVIERWKLKKACLRIVIIKENKGLIVKIIYTTVRSKLNSIYQTIKRTEHITFASFMGSHLGNKKYTGNISQEYIGDHM